MAPNRDDMIPTDDLAFWGCALALLTGAALTVLAIWMLATSSGPTPFRIAVLVVGIGNSLLAYRALYRSRIGWAFVTASCGTLGLICLFGAPKLRDLTGYSLGLSALPFIIFTVTTILLSFRRGL